MAPPRRVRPSMNGFQYSGAELDEQIQEMRRYEQEQKDRILALLMQRQINEAVQEVPPNRPPAPNRPALNTPAATQNIRAPNTSTPLVMVLRNMPNNVEPPSPIIAGAPNVRRRLLTPLAENQAEPIEARRTPGPIRNRTIRRPRSRAVSNLNRVRVVTLNESSDSDSTSSSGLISSSSDSNGSSTSSDSGNSSVTSPIIAIADHNQPSTSQVVPSPIRVGAVTTWGECTMCFEHPIQPQGCRRCFQLIGCKDCIRNWCRSSDSPSCPLCRKKWTKNKADVLEMATITRRQQYNRGMNQSNRTGRNA